MATHIKSLIRDFLNKKERERQAHEKVKTLIAQSLESCGQNHIQFQGIHKNKLMFSSEAASARYTLHLKRKELLSAVQKEFPHIKELEING
ncbi:MAG: hypothetical protein JSW17_03675 [Candidatus Omnitrophota bacterium]|nr:MAG: hypothetical protein JSW17_03675 [Candidatus Omnitrophota bacterium]